MRKSFLGILVLIVVFTFIAAPVYANTWDEWEENNLQVVNNGVLGDDMNGVLNSVAGYAEDGNAAISFAPTDGSRVFFVTDLPLSTPTYSIPCPADQLQMNCSYVARDPQTDDMGVANTENEGIVLDDLFTWVEDFYDQTANTQRHIAQALDILFYNNSSNGGVAPDGFNYPQGLAISQTLDQDLADFQGTAGGNGNGIAGVIWQNFNLAKTGPTLHTEEGDDIHTAAAGWIDQVIYAYVADIDGVSGANGTTGIKQSYLSKKIVVGTGGDVCTAIFGSTPCDITEQQGHPDVNINGVLDSANTLDKTVKHVTKTSMTDP